MFQTATNVTTTTTSLRHRIDLFDVKSVLFNPAELYQSLIGSLNWKASH